MGAGSSTARQAGRRSDGLVSAAKPHRMGSKKGAINTTAGKTFGQVSDRFPGATGQRSTSGPPGKGSNG